MSDHSQVMATNSRAANYGDGCFTTIAVLNGRLQLADYHLKRLLADCARLGIDANSVTVSCSDAELATQIQRRETVQGPISLQALMEVLVSAVDIDQAVIKILISRGNGGRGYSPANCSLPEVIVTLHAYPQHYTQLQSQGIVVGVSPLQLAVQPLLAGLKHLNRLEQVLIKQALNDCDYDDVLVTTTQGELIEASAANLFWLDGNGKWCTPEVSNAGVDGVYRRRILDYCRANNFEVNIEHFTLEDIMQATAVLLCNAVMQIVPVKKIVTDSSSTSFDIRLVQDLAAAIQNDGD